VAQGIEDGIDAENPKVAGEKSCPEADARHCSLRVESTHWSAVLA
jgi:hypothetical protein